MKIPADDYPRLHNDLLLNNNFLVDVGSSNIEKTLEYLSLYADAINDFDYIILPIVNESKSDIETQKTLAFLFQIGTRTHKIRLVLNKSRTVDDTDLVQEFSEAMHLADSFGIPRPTVSLKYHAIFSTLRRNHLTLQQVLDTDNQSLPTLQAFKQEALVAKANLDQVFKDLQIRL